MMQILEYSYRRSRVVEVNKLLIDIEEKGYHVAGILKRLYEVEEEGIPSVLKQLSNEKVISQKENEAIKLPSLVKIITNVGAGGGFPSRGYKRTVREI